MEVGGIHDKSSLLVEHCGWQTAVVAMALDLVCQRLRIHPKHKTTAYVADRETEALHIVESVLNQIQALSEGLTRTSDEHPYLVIHYLKGKSVVQRDQ